ncbi:MAG TPA: cell division protein FtsZ, partial [Alphaproteobacteria bacterium]|nr:cell division protein FtsZ [Alphaproteobacteria bacterium]
TTFADAFNMADQVLDCGVRGVTDLMVKPGLINLDFADIRTVMSEMGKAMMGTGEAEGQRRAIDAAEAAISNPLLDEVSLKGARAMLINITAGMDIALFEVDEAVNRVRAEVDPDANVIFGSTFDPSMEGRLRVSVVATGIDAQSMIQPQPARQPTLDVIRGGYDMGRKPQTGGLSAAMTAIGASFRPSGVAGGLTAQPVTMTATAEQLEPMAPEAAPMAAEPAMEAQAEPAPAEAAIAEPVVAPPPLPPKAEIDAKPEAFIPPRPMESGARMTVSTPPQPAQPPVEKKRARSLFERVTGAARRAEQQEEQAALTRAVPTFSTPPAFATRPAQPEPGAGQPRLGIDSPARPRASSPEDDLLEIPAFLRRQAN